MSLIQVTSIDANLPCEIFLTQGIVPSLEIKTDEATKEQIVTEIADHTLKLRFKETPADIQKIQIFITLQNLEKLTLENTRLGTTSHFKTQNLAVNLMGNCTLDMNVKVDTLRFSGRNSDVILRGEIDEQIINLSGELFNYCANQVQSKKFVLDGGDEDMSASGSQKKITLKADDVTITRCSSNTKIYFDSKPTILNNNSLAKLLTIPQESA